MTTFARRFIGAAMLDAPTYEEVEADRSATPQALAVVLISSLAAGIGLKGTDSGVAAVAFFATASVIGLLAWAAFALLALQIGARLLPTADTRVDAAQLLRTLGFAAAPGLIQIAGVLPGARTPVFMLAGLWTLAASVVAVRQAADYTSTARAAAVCALGWTLSLVVAGVLGLVFGPTLSGI
jgi:hypothetical protein